MLFNGSTDRMAMKKLGLFAQQYKTEIQTGRISIGVIIKENKNQFLEKNAG